ncbi:MAG: Flp family type IVb pilin [Gemmatimonadetes bacterium]|nr:Flp family type IVb pilin [Gemmatimonadota bacterium]
MKELFHRFMKDESGQGLVEYVLIIALVAIGLIGIMILFRNSIGNTFNNVTQKLDAAPGSQYAS